MTPEQELARLEAELRRRLAGEVVAPEQFDAYRPGPDGDPNAGLPIRVLAGQRIGAKDPVAVAFPGRFRRLSEAEVERKVELARRGWEYQLGL